MLPVAISREARRDIGDTILIRARPWAGSMDEVAFLGRLYDLDELPSYDTRFKGAARDIWQHRVNNPEDWEDDWVFHDARFNRPRWGRREPARLHQRDVASARAPRRWRGDSGAR